MTNTLQAKLFDGWVTVLNVADWRMGHGEPECLLIGMPPNSEALDRLHHAMIAHSPVRLASDTATVDLVDLVCISEQPDGLWHVSVIRPMRREERHEMPQWDDDSVRQFVTAAKCRPGRRPRMPFQRKAKR